MKLTNRHRGEWVSSIMATMKNVNHSDKIRQIVVKECVDSLPKKVQPVFRDPDLWSQYGDRVFARAKHEKAKGIYRHDMPDFSIAIPPGTEKVAEKEIKRPFIQSLLDEMAENIKARKELNNKLKGVANSCNSDKALREAVPEYAHLVPMPAEKVKPMVPKAEIDSLVKALSK